ncbi:hypothetical protein BOTBODRAFT_179690 [Botryobasidium botryosum FD-172 SS1]|uniref:Heterokaryon incompatibility domain-containing protein n=1 Tax=Botryobasidium botryosum (strain FD-172 SS1) TaxID=930990 RepID=A0A067M1N1_BOTB1|nr:hypothetical protein BOTBODRAFT_179690 [Botryobasidium botryosum FD-172 SS1]
MALPFAPEGSVSCIAWQIVCWRIAKILKGVIQESLIRPFSQLKEDEVSQALPRDTDQSVPFPPKSDQTICESTTGKSSDLSSYPIDPEIQKLVCSSCWSTVFSVDSFRAAWAVADSTPTASEPAAGGLTFVTPPWEQMQRSVDLMCEWCDLVCEQIEFYYHHKTKTRDSPPADMTFSLTVRFERSAGEAALCLKLVVEDSWTPAYMIHTAADDSAMPYIATREVVRQVNAPTTYDLAMGCIDDCLHHERCPPPQRATLPTRVIDCTDPAQPWLFIPDGAMDFYAALSYVWGESQPHSTTTKNLDSYIAGIDVGCIPKTICDAITVTHQLGLRYLWVDAFCIIQDSKEDKASEIAQMRSIFRNAYITIIAACARKVSEGFLHDRPAWYPTPSTLPFRCPDGTVGTMFLRPSGEPAPAEPVNTRAWCLEERVLSPRSLIYSSHTVQYECQSKHMNLGGAPNLVDPQDGRPRLPDEVFAPAALLVDGQANEVHQGMRAAWEEILRLYTARELTKPRDRLLALSGVVEQFHQIWPSSRYVAGLWTHQLPGSLLWSKSRPREHTRPKKYRAPSWSWAAVDGKIASTAITNRGVICSIIRCEAVLARQGNRYGEVTSGVLMLSAVVRKAVWDPVECELFEIGEAQVGPRDESQSERGEIGYVTPDAEEEVSEGVCEVSVVVLNDTGSTLLGLVLVPVTDGEVGSGPAVDQDVTIYRRVGFFTAPFCDKEAWLSAQSQLVQIV